MSDSPAIRKVLGNRPQLKHSIDRILGVVPWQQKNKQLYPKLWNGSNAAAQRWSKAVSTSHNEMVKEPSAEIPHSSLPIAVSTPVPESMRLAGDMATSSGVSSGTISPKFPGDAVMSPNETIRVERTSRGEIPLRRVPLPSGLLSLLGAVPAACMVPHMVAYGSEKPRKDPETIERLPGLDSNPLGEWTLPAYYYPGFAPVPYHSDRITVHRRSGAEMGFPDRTGWGLKALRLRACQPDEPIRAKTRRRRGAASQKGNISKQMNMSPSPASSQFVAGTSLPTPATSPLFMVSAKKRCDGENVSPLKFLERMNPTNIVSPNAYIESEVVPVTFQAAIQRVMQN